MDEKNLMFKVVAANSASPLHVLIIKYKLITIKHEHP